VFGLGGASVCPLSSGGVVPRKMNSPAFSFKSSAGC